jgi:hypothetical protein
VRATTCMNFEKIWIAELFGGVYSGIMYEAYLEYQAMREED